MNNFLIITEPAEIPRKPLTYFEKLQHESFVCQYIQEAMPSVLRHVNKTYGLSENAFPSEKLAFKVIIPALDYDFLS